MLFISHLQTVAKGLGAGYAAIGALMVHKDVVDVFSKGSKAFVHFQTYHGHPLACAAAYEVQQVIKDEDLVSNCHKMGEYLGRLLSKRLGSHHNVGDVRGRGLLWGVSDYHTGGDDSSTDTIRRSNWLKTRLQKRRFQPRTKSHPQSTRQA